MGNMRSFHSSSNRLQWLEAPAESLDRLGHRLVGAYNPGQVAQSSRLKRHEVGFEAIEHGLVSGGTNTPASNFVPLAMMGYPAFFDNA
jgi:hypothetical protein